MFLLLQVPGAPVVTPPDPDPGPGTGGGGGTPPSFSGAATRYDLVMDASAGAPGAARSGLAYPNGTWRGEQLTPFVAVGTGSGTFSPATLSGTLGSSDPVPFTYTPSGAGTHYIGATNTGSLLNPRPTPLTVMAASAGTARTLTASIASGRDQQPHQFDALGIPATGFSFAGAKGWGEVWLTIGSLSGATGGLFIRLYDALSSGANTTRGTGTALHPSPVQVYGQLNGAGELAVLMPASSYWYYADIATDAAFTNPIRIPQRFGIGLGIAVLGRSQESGVIQWYSDTSASGETWDRTVARFSSDERYANDSGPWCRSTGATFTDGDATLPNAAGAQYAGRLVANALGVMTFLVGVASSRGGGINAYINADGSFSDAFQLTVYKKNPTDTNDGGGFRGKFRWLWAGSLTAWDDEPQTYVETKRRVTAATVWAAAKYPSCAVQGWCLGGTGRPESTGTADLNSQRMQDIILSYLEPASSHIVSKDNYCWVGFKYDHANNSSKRLYIAESIRRFLSAETAAFGGVGAKYRGPTLTKTGTMVPGSRVVRLYGKLNGLSGVQTVKVTQLNPNISVSTNVSTAIEMASLVSLYAGTNGRYGTGLSIKLAGVFLSADNLPPGADFSLDVTLYGASGVTYEDGSTGPLPNAMTAHYAGELRPNGGTGYNVVNTTAEPPQPSWFSMVTATDAAGAFPFPPPLRMALDIAVTVS